MFQYRGCCCCIYIKDFEICKSSCCNYWSCCGRPCLCYRDQSAVPASSLQWECCCRTLIAPLLFQISGLQQNTLLPGLMSLVDGEVRSDQITTISALTTSQSLYNSQETNLGGDCEDSSGHSSGSSLGADQWDQDVIICSKHQGEYLLLLLLHLILLLLLLLLLLHLLLHLLLLLSLSDVIVATKTFQWLILLILSSGWQISHCVSSKIKVWSCIWWIFCNFTRSR